LTAAYSCNCSYFRLDFCWKFLFPPLKIKLYFVYTTGKDVFFSFFFVVVVVVVVVVCHFKLTTFLVLTHFCICQKWGKVEDWLWHQFKVIKNHPATQSLREILSMSSSRVSSSANGNTKPIATTLSLSSDKPTSTLKQNLKADDDRLSEGGIEEAAKGTFKAARSFYREWKEFALRKTVCVSYAHMMALLD
jgi:hypothetical protein